VALARRLGKNVSSLLLNFRHCASRVFLFAFLATFASAESIAITHVTVIDATGRPAQPEMTVIVAGERIAAIGPSKKAKVPRGAHIVDGSGKFLIPGLWDMHTHGATDRRATQSYPLYLANGVLGVREMFGPPDAGAWRVQHASSDKPSPTIFLASPIFDGPQPSYPTCIAVANEAQGREAVAQQKGRGADFIKVYSLLPRDAYFAIADEAHKLGIRFAGHVPTSVTAAEASDAGQNSIEHLYGVALGCSAREAALFAEMRDTTRANRHTLTARVAARAFESYDETRAGALFARFVRNGTWQCPTLTVLRSISRLDDPQSFADEQSKYIPKSGRPSSQQPGNSPFKDNTAEDWGELRTQFRDGMTLVGRMHRAGVGILAGTDTPNAYLVPGFGLHQELALLVDAGLSPMAALQAATRNAAQFMEQLDRRGTIEVGKIADLVLLDKDPLADIHHTTSVRTVVLAGKLMPRASLDAMLAEAQALAEK
jgi:imidazolonepropionase-like amidohydrolase